MTDFTVADAALLDRTDAALARPLPPGLAGARRDAVAAATAILAVPEEDLARSWDWIGGSKEEVRYGAYRAAEALELAEIEARAMLAPAEINETMAARLIAPATAARWDLHGLLLPLTERQLDADPGGGEWTLRLVLGHVIASQRGYGVGTAWWNEHPHPADDPALPASVPEAVYEGLPDESTTEAQGSLTELRDRLDHVLDLATERLAGLPDDRLGLAARWSGFAVTIGFRLGRWGSHIREHTIQVEKTLAMLGVTPGEPARLARNLLAAYGRAEATVYGRTRSDHLDHAVVRIGEAAAEGLAAITSAASAARLSR